MIYILDMSTAPHISLEHWRTLLAIIDAGGYAQAALSLHKSQSAVTYAVQKIETLLGVKVFEIQGRKAILTPTGQMLYRRASALVGEARELEHATRTLSAGWEAEIRLATEILFPPRLLLACLDRFRQESPHTRIEVIESVLDGTSEALQNGQVDLAIAHRVPSGFLCDPLVRMRTLAVAHPEHPLHHLGRELTQRDLRTHLHLVVRDSGARRDLRDHLAVEVEQRWTVSHLSTSIDAVRRGYGFAWLPEEHIRDELKAGTLKPLPLREGREGAANLYLILAEPDLAGPGVRRLAQIIREDSAADSPISRGAA